MCTMYRGDIYSLSLRSLGGHRVTTSFLDIDFLRVERMIRECCVELGLRGKVQYACIYRSHEYFDDRFVFNVSVGGDAFALKVDYASPSTGRLQREYDTLIALNAYFDPKSKIAVPKPIYYSPSESFFAMTYVSGETATTAIRNSKRANGKGQVFRQAGEWLNHLHRYQGSEEIKLWPNWMAEAINAAVGKQAVADPSDIGRMSDQLRIQLQSMTGRPGLKVFSHGDYHASNIILKKEVCFGFDLTEVTNKLAVYDIVDFLKSDIYWTEPTHEIDCSGVSKQCKTLFFGGYRLPVDTEVLDLCIRGRLLIDWLNISEERYQKSAFQRDKFDRLKARLDIAFSGS